LSLANCRKLKLLAAVLKFFIILRRTKALEITSRQLINQVFELKAVPRVPVGFWFHFLAEERFGCGTGSFFSENVRGHRRFIETFKPDMVKIMSDGFFNYPSKRVSDNPADMLGSLDTVTANHPWIRDQVRLVEAVRALQDDTSYFYNVFSPATTLRFMIGREALLKWLKEYPLESQKLLNEMSRGLTVLATEVISQGRADGVYFSVQNPDLNNFSDDDYLKFLFQGEIDLLNEANLSGGQNILHICGYAGVKNNLPFYANYPAQAFSWAVNVENVSLKTGQKLFGGKAVIGGFPNIRGSIIHTGQKEEIEAFTRKILEETGRIGVIIGADCTVPSDIDLEHLNWVREAAK
jgi:uroporphyrinogen decarboxylase